MTIDYRAIGARLPAVEKSLRDQQVAIGGADQEAGALRIKLGNALLNAKLGIGTNADVQRARTALTAHIAATEQESLDVECMGYALPRFKDRISDGLRILNDELRRTTMVENNATYEALIQEFDRKLQANEYKTLMVAQPAINELAAKVAKINMMQRLRDYLRDNERAFPMHTKLP